ncbi:MAG: ATP-dependent DNA helicase [Nitrospirota bacterium]
MKNRLALSPPQTAAIEHGKSPLLIIAGAGTGKTLVITHRIAHLIASKRARPHEILALTFTEKAASEMEERVDLLTPYGYTDVTIQTFHAFGDRLLREYGMRIGLSPDFRVLSYPEQVIFFKEHLFDFPLKSYRPLGNPTKYIESILKHISRAKDEDILAQDYLLSVERQIAEAASRTNEPAFLQEITLQKELALTYQAYQDTLIKEDAIDFGDQVFLALSLLKSVPALLKRLPYKYILVDEFQDTNTAQFRLVSLLAEPNAQLTVVGDDDQSIYKFRGAAISNIQNFTKIYPTATRVVLTENFRSRQEILDAAYRLISYNNPNRLEVIEKIDKRLISSTLREKADSERAITHRHFDTTANEADYVAHVISEAVSQGAHYSDFAILVRRNAAADPYIRALNLSAIPSRSAGNRGLFSRMEVRLLIAFLRVVVDRHDSRSLYFLLCSDLYRFPLRPLSEKMTEATRKNSSLYSVLEATYKKEGAETDESAATFQKLEVDLSLYLNRAKEVDAGVVLYEFIRASGLLLKLSEDPTPTNDAIIQNIARFFGEIKKICQWTKTAFLHDVIGSLDLLIAAGEDPPSAEADLDADAVKVLTVHRAKGLEFHTVFMVALTDGAFPTRNRSETLVLPDDLIPDPVQQSHSHIAEERRLFYVGMTRAKETLYLTSAQNTGGSRLHKVSPFIIEALDLPISAILAVKSSPLETIAREGGGAPTEGMNRHVVVPVKQTPDDVTTSNKESHPLTLSHYQIDDYLTCPLKYKYIHILRVPIYKNHAIVYGSAIHQAIAAYLTARVSGDAFSLDDLLLVLEKGWKSEGYLSREHEEQRLATGRIALQKFYEKEEQSNHRPTHVEKDFSFLFEGVKIKGRFDRMDQVGEEVNDGVIIDYKTSEVSDQKEADKKARESEQLDLYAWAYLEKNGVLPKTVHLYFLDSGIIGTDIKEEKDIEKMKKKVRQAANGIRTGDFTARPTYIACQYCPYQEICPYTAS